MLIEPHIHMVSRLTEDYLKLARHGVNVVCEPAFWAGYDRRSLDAFTDYFEQLTTLEPERAARYGVRHYCWLSVNPKEAADLDLAREVLQVLPDYLNRDNVLGVGEIGLHCNAPHEIEVLEWQVELAARREELVLLHTPHLEDKWKGTRLILDVIRNEPRLEPERVLVDHAEEHTIGLIRERGCWAGITIYPVARCSTARAVDILETWGLERVWLNSSADWAPSDALAVVAAREEMRRRGFSPVQIGQVLYANPVSFLRQCPHFKMPI